MEKILLAVNATRLNTQTIDFACYIARLTGSRLTAFLLEDIPAPPVPVSVEIGTVAFAGASASMAILPREMEKETLHQDAARFFKEACAARNVNCYIYRNRHVPVHEIIEESRFADVLIVDADISFESFKDPVPTIFVKTLLSHAECPVIVAPRNFSRIDEIIFAYDGSASSVFAIKQFTYLFPGLDNKTAAILHVKENNDWTAEEKRRIGDWLKPHYSVINFRLLKGKPKDELLSYLMGRDNLFVVMGAFGRSMVSRLVKTSNAEPILKAADLPVFITHY
jgi:hypothetical protein